MNGRSTAVDSDDQAGPSVGPMGAGLRPAAFPRMFYADHWSPLDVLNQIARALCSSNHCRCAQHCDGEACAGQTISKMSHGLPDDGALVLIHRLDQQLRPPVQSEGSNV